MRDKANDTVVYATWAWIKYVRPHCLQWDKFVLRTHLPTPDGGSTYTTHRCSQAWPNERPPRPRDRLAASDELRLFILNSHMRDKNEWNGSLALRKHDFPQHERSSADLTGEFRALLCLPSWRGSPPFYKTPPRGHSPSDWLRVRLFTPHNRGPVTWWARAPQTIATVTQWYCFAHAPRPIACDTNRPLNVLSIHRWHKRLKHTIQQCKKT